MSGSQDSASGRSSLEPTIPKREFRGRVSKVQQFLVSKGLGGLVVFSTSRAHIWYQTGHVSYISNWSDLDRIGDMIVVVPAQGEPAMLLSGLPYMIKRGQEVSWIQDIRLVGAFDSSAPADPRVAKTFGTEARAILNERGQAGKQIGIVGLEYMPVPMYRSLLDAFGESEIEDVEDIIAELRAIKSSAEIAIMRKAAQLSDLGYETLLDCAKDGMWGYEAVAQMERAVRAQGADYVKYWMNSGPGDGWPVTIMDLRPHVRRLHKGDQVSCCSYVVYNGYWAHAMRTGFMGEPSPQQQRMFPACIEAHKTAIEAIKPGVRISDAVKAVRRFVEKAGMKVHCARIGHGIGLDYGERPAYNEDNPLELQSGHVIEVHTQFDLPGTESFYVPLGDVLHVTDDGVETLTKFPHELFRIPI